jgi:hypothetical protein
MLTLLPMKNIGRLSQEEERPKLFARNKTDKSLRLNLLQNRAILIPRIF